MAPTPPTDPSPSPVLRIGRCVVDPRLGELSRDGEAVALGRRAFKVLMVLLEGQGELVSNEDILHRVWDGTVVEHNTVQAQISLLRRALGDDRALLKTYPGRGYRLMTAAQSTLAAATRPGAPTSAAPSQARLIASNLPSTISELIGRQGALEELTELFSGHRLVTVAGSGGIGKTRLVVEAAARSLDAFPGGVFFVDLASLADADLVPSTIVAEISIEGSFHASLREQACALGDEPALIVLDNCEHLVDAATRAAETLLRSNAFLHIVATSREPLRARGEMIYRVSSLEVPGATANTDATLRARGASRLFLERAGIHDRHLAVDPAAPDAVAKICRDLDGIPLAIELAAARATSLGVHEVASRLHESLDLLRGGDRTALPRQRTLRATLEWSHDLLSSSERVVLRRLAVFVGGFQMDAACRAASDDRLTELDVVGHVADLVEKSLLSTDRATVDPRYRLLETTRAFALECLSAAGEVDVVARRHAAYRLESLEQLDTQSQTPRHLPAMRRFRLDIDNLRAALDWAYSDTGDTRLGFALASCFAPVLLDLLLIEECMTRAASALARTPSSAIDNPLQELKLRTALASSQVYIEGPGEAAMRSWNEALARSRAVGDRSFEIRALWGLWTTCTFAGLPTQGLEWATAFDRIARRTRNADSVLLAHRIQGISLHYLGRHAEARSLLESMIARYVHGAHPIKMGGLMNHGTVARATLARVLWFQGFADRSSSAMRESVRDALHEDHALTISYVMVECAIPLSLLVGDERAARDYLALLITSSRRQGLLVLQVIGRCYETLLDGDEASKVGASMDLTAALERLSALHFDLYSADLSIRAVHALFDGGKADEALALNEANIERTRRSGERLWEAELLRTRAAMRLASGRSESLVEAEQQLRDALAVAHDQTSLSLELRTATTLARLLGRLGRVAEGGRLLEGVYARFTEGFGTPDMIEARTLLDSLRVASRETTSAMALGH